MFAPPLTPCILSTDPVGCARAAQSGDTRSPPTTATEHIESISLPDLAFMHSKPNSRLINAGILVELPFKGPAPDLGAFEVV